MTATGVLGNASTNSSSTSALGEETYDPASILRRRRRFDAGWLIRDLNAWLFPDQRVGTCGAPRGSAVMAERRQDGRVQIAGIETCGSVSGCLRCAAIIRAARAEEIDYWAKAHLTAGGDLVFVTYTLPHLASDELTVLLEGMRDSWTAMNSGQGSMRVRERFGIRGFIRSYEFTYGTNGWHPHLHVLYFLDANRELHNEDSEPLAEMRSVLGARWGHQISSKLERDIHGVYGVDARTVRDMAGIGDYISKIHFEMVRSDLKIKEQDRQRGGSRTPWQVGIDGVRNGERTDIARWREYVEATKGLRVHEPSRSIRVMYGKPETTGADMTDQQLAAETPEQGTPEVGIANDLWGTARRTRRNSQSVIARALLALEDHGLEAMRLSLEHDLRRAVVIDHGGELPLLRFRSAKAEHLVATTNSQREENSEEAAR